MSNIESVFKDKDTYSAELTDYVNELRARAGDKMLDKFSEMRQFSIETIKENNIFYIGDATEMLIPSYLNKVESFGVISTTNKKPIFHNRFVMPIKDIDGKVLNLVGYSKEADERYVYGTARYYRRRETMYGLENLEMAYNLGYAILTEGITDAICLRNLGFKNSFANCGTHKSDFIMKQLNRCRNGVIKVPDRDAAGKKAASRWKCNRSITLNTFIAYKDIDEMCKSSIENKELVREYLNICVNWILSNEHRGYNTIDEVITIQ